MGAKKFSAKLNKSCRKNQISFKIFFQNKLINYHETFCCIVNCLPAHYSSKWRTCCRHCMFEGLHRCFLSMYSEYCYIFQVSFINYTSRKNSLFRPPSYDKSLFLKQKIIFKNIFQASTLGFGTTICLTAQAICVAGCIGVAAAPIP